MWEAVTIYHQLLILQPTQPDILSALALIEKRHGNRTEAETPVRRAIAVARYPAWRSQEFGSQCVSAEMKIFSAAQ